MKANGEAGVLSSAHLHHNLKIVERMESQNQAADVLLDFKVSLEGTLWPRCMQSVHPPINVRSMLLEVVRLDQWFNCQEVAPCIKSMAWSLFACSTGKMMLIQ